MNVIELNSLSLGTVPNDSGVIAGYMTFNNATTVVLSRQEAETIIRVLSDMLDDITFEGVVIQRPQHEGNTIQ